MKTLLSLPPNLVKYFNEQSPTDNAQCSTVNGKDFFCTNDPIEQKLGSGGGTVWLLQKAYEASGYEGSFMEWLSKEKRILLHAGGQGRRLPSYSPSGKILTPIPVFRWERGQRLSQDLLSLQLPFCQRIINNAPDNMHTLIVSGDVYIRSAEQLQPVPEADVVCYGLWLDAETATNHGVFVSSHDAPSELKYMLQKPSVETLNELKRNHYYLTDIGVWLLSDKAVEVLVKKTLKNQPSSRISHPSSFIQYDLYGQFGCCLGTNPTLDDEDIRQLKVAILPLPEGEFYHYGTSHELISSTLRVQNIISDQREIMHKSRKPHPSMFVQNAETWLKINSSNHHLWIENSCLSEHWTIENHHIITGVPRNDWHIDLHEGQCVDIVPIGEDSWAVRPYGYNDLFKGNTTDNNTFFTGQPLHQWFAERHIEMSELTFSSNDNDIQEARLFPVVSDIGDIGLVLRWMLNEPHQQGGRMLWQMSRRISANEIAEEANLQRLFEQRADYRKFNWSQLSNNYNHSVFYQIDLQDAAKEFSDFNLPMPHPLPDNTPLITRMQDAMFRAEYQQRRGGNAKEYGDKAFKLLSKGILEAQANRKCLPKLQVFTDQIVWGRSPVRIDIAGGWTDTPPYCLMEGGKVINLAIELNGQPPLQTYVKPCKEHHIVLRSIDLGATEIVETYEQLCDFHHVGSPFSIPKAALVLAGFHPDYCEEHYSSLAQQLEAFGAGIEVTLLSAIPAGSGLGTSSILAANVLGTLSHFCSLGWDKNEIGRRTLVLEQLLTTGGGWQDQFGGLLQGVKLLETERGICQSPVVRWLPTDLFTKAEYRDCHLLYYTGITRTAKTILAEIVHRMFLNQHEQLALLRQMKAHTMNMYEALQRNDFQRMGQLVRKTWTQNQLLDSGTNPEQIEKLTQLIDDLCLGYKLPGAGGGGFLYMIAKDPDAATRIRQKLTQNKLNHNARFVDMTLSENGLQVSRS